MAQHHGYFVHFFHNVCSTAPHPPAANPVFILGQLKRTAHLPLHLRHGGGVRRRVDAHGGGALGDGAAQRAQLDLAGGGGVGAGGAEGGGLGGRVQFC